MLARLTALLAVGALLLSVAACGAKASSPSLSALTDLPAAAGLSAQVKSDLGGMAHNASVTASAAVRGTRLLRSGVAGKPMYAFGGPGGRVCFLVVDGVGTCGRISAAKDVLWAVNRGDPKAGQAVVGVVSDPVVAVSVQVGPRVVRVKPFHNSFVVPFKLRAGQRLPQISATAVLG